ncbi:hypothetical protein BZA05DRAFT_392341 [Tricharina praecox]|uniref:uncharacterized protein n=1 Tax=Tricharina praecox TaxID=43433 RepID=UPI00221FCFE2|nr:uncharacterized protein BZA05DRAFT_392341 [Tricharina praecox]KAI5854721.1 hypothetical protein BZA05DRAFT_392341 [Tricharina praecox]
MLFVAVLSWGEAMARISSDCVAKLWFTDSASHLPCLKVSELTALNINAVFTRTEPSVLRIRAAGYRPAPEFRLISLSKVSNRGSIPSQEVGIGAILVSLSFRPQQHPHT